MSSNETKMDTSFVDRKEFKIQSPSREVAGPDRHLFIPLGSQGQSSAGQRSPVSDDPSYGQRLSEDASNNNHGVSITDSVYFGGAFPASLTSDQEAALLLELEQEHDPATVTTGHLQFDMRYIDRKEAKINTVPQESRSMSDLRTGSQTTSQEDNGRTFSNLVATGTNRDLKSPYVSVITNPLRITEDEEDEKQDSQDRAYEIRSTTSVMLFQERNLFADDKDSTDITDTSSEEVGEVPVAFERSDSWRSESLAAKLWRQTDSQSSATEDLPEVEVFPALASIEDLQDRKTYNDPWVQETTNGTSAELERSSIHVAVSNSTSSNASNTSSADSRTSSYPGQGQEVTMDVVEENFVSNASMPQMLERLPENLSNTDVSPVKAIEVERKFVITSSSVDKLKEMGAVLNTERTFTDRYFDDLKYSLMLQDCWLRQRNQNWELKVPRGISCTLATQYEEITNEREVVKYLMRHFNVEEFSAELRASSLVKIIGLEEFATFTTHRQSYSLPQCSVDLDITDFGFQVGEIEVMVTNESRIPAALNTIEDVANKLGFQCLSQLQ